MATTIRSILNRKGGEVVTITPTSTLGQAAAVLAEHNIGAIVVSADGRTVDGILSERDIVRRFAATEGIGTSSVAVAAAMTEDVYTTGPDSPIDAMVKTMTTRRFRHVPIVEAGGLVGIVSIGDVVKSRMDQLEIEKESLQEYVTGTSY